MKVIRTTLKDVNALRRRFLPEMQHGGLFVPNAVDLEVGEPVCLWMQLHSHCADLHLYGIVYWLRHRSGNQKNVNLRTGAGIGFRAGQEEQVAFLRRALSSHAKAFPVRRPTRTPLLSPWRCHLKWDSADPRAAVLTDISDDGAQCMVGPIPVEPGHQVEVLLPWHSETPHVMEVAWKRQSDTRFRLGLRRTETDAEAEEEWRALSDRARRQFTSQIWTRISQPPEAPV